MEGHIGEFDIGDRHIGESCMLIILCMAAK